MSSVNAHALEGHVFKNLTVGIYTQCEERCVWEEECVSVNIGPHVKDRKVCELSNADYLKHPEDLKPRLGWTYSGTEVRVVKVKNVVIKNGD